MKKQHRRIALLLALSCLLALSLSACKKSETAAGDEKITIGVLFDFLSVESRVRQRDVMEAYAKEKGVELVFQNANGDEKLQLQQGGKFDCTGRGRDCGSRAERGGLHPACEAGERGWDPFHRDGSADREHRY